MPVGSRRRHRTPAGQAGVFVGPVELADPVEPVDPVALAAPAVLPDPCGGVPSTRVTVAGGVEDEVPVPVLRCARPSPDAPELEPEDADADVVAPIVWRKTTWIDAVSPGSSWTSATKLEVRSHGRRPPVSTLPAIWVTCPRKRKSIAPLAPDPVAAVEGSETSEPTSWTSAPVVPVMSTARIEPPAARHVPTLTLTGAAEPDIGLMEPVAWKAGPPLAEAKLWVPVLMTATRVSELSGGVDVGAVTPGNPATPVQVPIGRL